MKGKNLIAETKKNWEELWLNISKNPTFKPAWLERPIPPEIPHFIEKKYLPSKGNVLDIGCGTAEISLWFYKYGSYVVEAFDISANAIELAKTAHAQTNIHFFCHNICEEALNKKYDILIDRGCLHTIDKDLLEKYATHIANACNPHAKFLIFMRAFRSSSGESHDEELNRLKNNIEFLFSKFFDITLMGETNLGKKEEDNMPGLFFLLTRHAI